MRWDVVAFDTETTGLGAAARIVSAAIAEFVYLSDDEDDDRVGHRSSEWRLRAGVHSSPRAAAVHGLRPGALRAEGRQPSECLLEIQQRLQHEWSSGRAVVAYNSPFDFNVLSIELARHALPPVQPVIVIDPLLLWRVLEPRYSGSRRLEEALRHLGLPQHRAHDAAADAAAALDVLIALLERHQLIDDEVAVIAQMQHRNARPRSWPITQPPPAELSGWPGFLQPDGCGRHQVRLLGHLRLAARCARRGHQGGPCDPEEWICVDAEGDRLWSRSLSKARLARASDGLAVWTLGHGRDSVLVACDLRTGDDLWRQPLVSGDHPPRVSPTAMPLLVHVEGVNQLVARDLSTGVVAWAHDTYQLWPGAGDPLDILPSPTPVYEIGNVVLFSGSLGCETTHVYALYDDGDADRAYVLEKQYQQRVAGYLGIVAAFDRATGRRLWTLLAPDDLISVDGDADHVSLSLLNIDGRGQPMLTCLPGTAPLTPADFIRIYRHPVGGEPVVTQVAHPPPLAAGADWDEVTEQGLDVDLILNTRSGEVTHLRTLDRPTLRSTTKDVPTTRVR